MNKQLPVLYSFRRCPYAMRARLSLAVSGVAYEHREILLKDKPQSMLNLSNKGTVPVLVVGGTVLDESLDVMLWALQQNDPDNWLQSEGVLQDMLELIENADGGFKNNLDKYKYSSRFPDGEVAVARGEAVEFLKLLEQKLNASQQLYGDNISLADMAIFPFVRQFAGVDPNWFNALALPALQLWLKGHIESDLFNGIMTKHVLWSKN